MNLHLPPMASVLRAFVAFAVFSAAYLVGPFLGCAAPMDGDLLRYELDAAGVKRELLVHVPAGAKTTPAPVIFAFHGHGGSMQFAARKFALHQLWPEAIVLYPQGLPTAGQLVDPEGKAAGWQNIAGIYGDRDLLFFDAMLAELRKRFQVDGKRIYVMGHSNGGGMTYLLWAARGEQIAAVAPIAAAGLRVLKDLKPMPLFHVAGQHDPIVKFAWQQMTIDAVRNRVNQCGPAEPWPNSPCTLYPSQSGHYPVVTYIHAGGHEVPDGTMPLIVRFFREHRKE